MSQILEPELSGNRFAAVTPDDHSGIAWCIAILFGTYSCLSLGLRLYLKRKTFGLDDIFCASATVRATHNLDVIDLFTY